MKTHSKKYWEDRWIKGESAWDIKAAAPAIVQLIVDKCTKSDKILFPGSGSGHEAALLYHEYGYRNICICDWAALPLEQFSSMNPLFPKAQILHCDFFSLKQPFDVIVEQTFFCAIPPDWRDKYLSHCHKLLNEDGRMMGLLFNRNFNSEGPPFGGNKEEYQSYFEHYFKISRMEECMDSIGPRLGSELIFEAIKKKEVH